jgi:hypothetical protein
MKHRPSLNVNKTNRKFTFSIVDVPRILIVNFIYKLKFNDKLQTIIRKFHEKKLTIFLCY